MEAEAEAEAQRLRTEAEVRTLKAREEAAQAYATHPALLRLVELEAIRDLGQNANARIYLDLDRGSANGDAER